MIEAYLDESSIEKLQDETPEDLEVWSAWYLDQDGGELGYLELARGEKFPLTIDASELMK